MRDVHTPASRASSPASRLRAHVGELLRVWEETEPEGPVRDAVRSLLEACLEEVAAALEDGARANGAPEIDLEPEALTAAARGIIVVRDLSFAHLQLDEAARDGDGCVAERVFDQALHAVLDRIAEEREQLARLAAEAFRAARMHHEAVELRERMLSIVSHDLRTPLAAIDLGGAVLLELPSTRGDPFVQKQIGVIRRNVERMSRIIRDLLDMSSIHAGRLSLECERCSVAQLIREGVDALQVPAREKGVGLRCELEVGDETIRCDPERMRSVLSHLIGHALRSCEAGAEIRVDARVRGGEVRVAISDTGPGIAEAELPHVFNVFWKGRGPRGSGLGLYVARGIVEAHDGRIGAERNEPRGSTLWFALPLEPPPQRRLEP